MEIIKEGKKNTEICKHCSCKFTYNRKDIKRPSELGGGSVEVGWDWVVECPCCGQRLRATDPNNKAIESIF